MDPWFGIALVAMTGIVGCVPIGAGGQTPAGSRVLANDTNGGTRTTADGQTVYELVAVPSESPRAPTGTDITDLVDSAPRIPIDPTLPPIALSSSRRDGGPGRQNVYGFCRGASGDAYAIINYHGTMRFAGESFSTTDPQQIHGGAYVIARLDTAGVVWKRELAGAYGIGCPRIHDGVLSFDYDTREGPIHRTLREIDGADAAGDTQADAEGETQAEASRAPAPASGRVAFAETGPSLLNLPLVYRAREIDGIVLGRNREGDVIAALCTPFVSEESGVMRFPFLVLVDIDASGRVHNPRRFTGQGSFLALTTGDWLAVVSDAGALRLMLMTPEGVVRAESSFRIDADYGIALHRRGRTMWMAINTYARSVNLTGRPLRAMGNFDFLLTTFDTSALERYY